MAKNKQDLAARQEIMKQRQLMRWKGTGRPPKFVDPELVDRYAKEGATDQEIAARVGVTVETLRTHYAEIMESARTRFTARLIYALYDLAMSGNFVALKFALEFHFPESFPAKPGRWQPLKPRPISAEARQRRLLRFFSRPRIQSSLRKSGNSSRNPRNSRQTPQISSYAAISKNLSPGWLRARRTKPKLK